MSLAGRARRTWRERPAARAGVLVVAAFAVAEGAVLLLSPAEAGIPADPVGAAEIFGPDLLSRVSDYRDGQLALGLGALGCQALAVGAVALGRPRRARRALAVLARRPVLGVAAAGALVAVIAELAALPAGLASHERAVDFGISSQSLGPWLWDRALGMGISAGLIAAAAVVLVALVRRFPRGWPAPGAAAAVAISAAVTLAGPVLFAPRFNAFEKLEPASELRAEVLELAGRAGVEIGDVYRVDASRRSSTLNAYVAGLGPTRRVVLYDTLIEQAPRDELRSVVAHELGHVAHDDLPRGILFIAIVAPLGLVLAREIAGALARRAGAEPGSPASLPALLVAVSLVALLLNIPGNQLSRRVEASADAFALRVTGDPGALEGLQKRLVRTNLSNPDPPAIARILFGTHPSADERIGSARAWARGER